MSSVDVIIPCYKYAHYLRDCAQSVLAQKGVELRVLIIDDCSPDNTAEVGEQLAREDSRVEFRRHAINRGNIETYNEGLAWANATSTLLISADDLLIPGALGRAAKIFDEHPEVGMVVGRVIRFRNDEPLPTPATLNGHCHWKVLPGNVWLDRFVINRGDGVFSPEVMHRTALWRRLGGFRKDLPFSGDVELWARFALSGAVGVLDADQAFYRVHASNMHLRRDHKMVQLYRDRLAAFTAAFTTHSNRTSEHCDLEELCYRSLAREALWDICKAYDRGDGASVDADALIAFACEAWPATPQLKEYRSAQRRLRCGRKLWPIVRRMVRGPSAAL